MFSDGILEAEGAKSQSKAGQSPGSPHLCTCVYMYIHMYVCTLDVYINVSMHIDMLYMYIHMCYVYRCVQ